MLRIAKRTIQITAAAAAFGALAAAPALAGPIGAYTTKGAWSFVTAPKLHPPQLHTDKPTVAKQLAGGDFLVANFPDLAAANAQLTGQSGPLILDSKLQPVWFDPINVNQVAMNLEQQSYQGKPVLSWWQGVISNTGATVSGEDVVVNQKYKQVATLTGDTKDGWVLSPHEFVVSGSNAWVTAYKVVPNVDLSAEGGSKSGSLLDSAVQEYNLKTGQLEYSWDAYNPGGTPNIPLSESEATPAPSNPNQPWDAYHVNSIQLTGSGTFLTSMRNTWTAYLVNKNTNQIEWRLGGKSSSFNFSPSSAQFQWQHDVQLGKGNVVTVFDDHCCAIEGVKNGTAQFAKPTGPSRGLVLQLNPSTHTATLVHQYSRGSSFNAAFLGSTQVLPNGNVLVGWGSTPYFTEYSKTGKVLLEAKWPGDDLSYRAQFIKNWVGTPYFPPSGAARNKGTKSTVYASWDGATKVVSWRVLAGSGAKHLTAVATKAKTGFETAIGLSTKYGVYKVQALDAKGHVLGTSKAFSAPKGSAPKNSSGTGSTQSGSSGYGFY